MKKILRLTAYFTGGFIFPATWLLMHYGCNADSRSRAVQAAMVKKETGKAIVATPALAKADAATILNRQEVPVLCYHQLRDWKPSDSKVARDYIVPIETFRQQIKSLADSGYHSITPDQLHDYLAYGTKLPSRPVMITFDDSRLDQYTIGREELNKYGFKGVFFIMTVALGKPGYMSKEQVKQLSDEGHCIGSHTYDHQNVKKYTDKEWQEQIARPSQQLEAITGKKVDYFAYPFGLWNKQAIPHLKEHFKSVFQLYAPRDEQDPLFTIRRIIVTGDRNGAGMQRQMRSSFHY